MIHLPGAWRFYLVNSLFAAGRMGIGATAVVYMLSRGATLGDVAAVKLIQGLVIFFAEVPTGLVADVFGRRASVIAAALSAIGSFLAFHFGGSFASFAIGEVLNGLAIAFWSGAFEALTVDRFRAPGGNKRLLEFLFSRMGLWSAAGTAAGGYVGGVLGARSLQWPFLFATAIMAACIASILLFLREDAPRGEGHAHALSMRERVSAANRKMAAGFREAIAQGLLRPELRSFFAVQVAIQFMLQPVFHYWQPYFQGFGPEVTPDVLGTIFFAYVGAQLVASLLVSELIKRTHVRTEILVHAQIALIVASFWALGMTGSLALAVAAFLLMQGLTGTLRNLLSASFNPLIPSERRATVLSSVSLVSRLGMLACLGIMGGVVKALPLGTLYLLSAAGALTLFPLYLSWTRAEQKVGPTFLQHVAFPDCRSLKPRRGDSPARAGGP